MLEEAIVEKLPNMGKETATQVQETQKVPNRIIPRVNILRHIFMKITKSKYKELILKAIRVKQQITQKGISIRVIILFNRIYPGQREWQDILKVMK